MGEELRELSSVIVESNVDGLMEVVVVVGGGGGALGAGGVILAGPSLSLTSTRGE